MKKYPKKHKRTSRFISEKRQKSRKRNIIIICTLVVVASSGLVGFYVAKKTVPAIKKWRVFQYSQVVINETEHISAGDIQALIGGPTKENLFDLDLEAVKAKVLKHPWVLDVKVTRLFPDRLRIDLQEKRPVSILSQDGLFFLDQHGKKIASIRPQENADLPILSGFSKKDLNRGELIRRAYQLLRLYEDTPFLQKWVISEIHWKNNGYILFTKSPVFEVRMGNHGFSKKLLRLEKVLKDLSQKNRHPKLVDLNFSKKVIVKLAK